MSCIQKVSVLNPENMAVTEYTSYPFNSLVFFNGKYLGFTDTGVYELTGDTDDGAEIPKGRIETGTIDINVPQKQRVLSAWVVARKQGLIRFSVRADENEEYIYDSSQTSNYLKEERIKIGRGIRGRVFSFGLENFGNQPCAINSIRVMSEPIKKAR